MKKIDRVYRLTLPKSLALTEPRVENERHAICGDVQSLVWNLRQDPSSFLIEDLQRERSEQQSSMGSFCDARVLPDVDTGFVLRLSYRVEREATRLQFVRFDNPSSWIVDHWVSQSPVFSRASSRGRGSSKSTRSPAGEKDQRNLASTPSHLLAQNAEPVAVDDLMRAQGAISAWSTRELNPLRFIAGEKNLGPEPQEKFRASLRVPHVVFPVFEDSALFDPFEFDWQRFESVAIFQNLSEAEQTEWGQSLRLLKRYFNLKDFLRAREILDILEKSAIAKKLDQGNPAYQMLKGHISVELSRSLSQPLLAEKAIRDWETTLIQRRDYGGADFYFLNQVFNATVLYYREHGQFSKLLTWTEWSHGVVWLPWLEERIRYLNAEAMYREAQFVDAAESFLDLASWLERNKKNGERDLRFLPLALGGAGNAYLKAFQVERAIQTYESALQRLPKQKGRIFEGKPYPDDIRNMPNLLLNLAESYMRVGREADALREFRAFVYFHRQDTRIGHAYFRAGILLDRVGADRSQVLDVWRECEFKVGQSMGGRLCSAMKNAFVMKESSKDSWPRQLAAIDDIVPSGDDSGYDRLFRTQLQSYRSFIKSYAFMEAGLYQEALAVVDQLYRIDLSSDHSQWRDEYFRVAFSGVQMALLKEKKYREVLTRFDQERKNRLLHRLSPAIVFHVARAQYQLQMWDELYQTLGTLRIVQKAYSPRGSRPMDVVESDVVAMYAESVVELAVRNRFRLGEAERIVSELSNSDMPQPELQASLRLRLAQARSDPAGTALAWRALASQRDLNWNEFMDWIQTTEKSGNIVAAKSILKSRVEPWFEANKALPVELPHDALLKYVEFFSAERPQVAMEMLTVLLAKFPETSGVNFSRSLLEYRAGEIQKRQRNLASARQYFEAASRTSPPDIWSRMASQALQEIDFLDNLAKKQ